ncbi:MAG: hypothetical protein GF331_16925 [Chitinivibrionales bacterium]|nr:hypothetical protein [Chitinivibrionales bacterium]
MLTYEENRTLFDILEHFHKAVRDQYCRLAAKATDRRSQMLLEYLCDQQSRAVEAWQRYRREAPRQVGSRWYQYVPNEPKLRVEPVPEDRELAIDEVASLALTYSDRLQAFFGKLAEKASDEDAGEVYRGLLEQERSERDKLLLTADELKKL